MKQLGYPVGGFDAYTTSNVLKGSGLSSSAAFEVLVGTILNHLYAKAKSDPVEIAQIGQYAENVYFGKPCGLMDQTASSVGGFVAIDFCDPRIQLWRRSVSTLPRRAISSALWTREATMQTSLPITRRCRPK